MSQESSAVPNHSALLDRDHQAWRTPLFSRHGVLPPGRRGRLVGCSGALRVPILWTNGCEQKDESGEFLLLHSRGGMGAENYCPLLNGPGFCRVDWWASPSMTPGLRCKNWSADPQAVGIGIRLSPPFKPNLCWDSFFPQGHPCLLTLHRMACSPPARFRFFFFEEVSRCE